MFVGALAVSGAVAALGGPIVFRVTKHVSSLFATLWRQPFRNLPPADLVLTKAADLCC